MSNWCVWVTECDGMRHFTVPTVELHQGNYSKRDSVRDPNTLPFLCIINSELWHGKWSFSHLCTFTHASRNKAVWTEIKFHKGPPSLSASYWINACVMTAVMRNEVPVGEIWLIQSFDGGKSSLSQSTFSPFFYVKRHCCFDMINIHEHHLFKSYYQKLIPAGLYPKVY